jgi:hypothetical protein
MVASRQIVPQDVGIQTPFSTIGNVLVAGPTTSKITDGGLLPSFVFNVRGYGAVGDNTADDTASFSAAISAAYTAWSNNTAQPQIVYIPRGIYKITSQIISNSVNSGLINGFVSFIGDGSMQSILNVSAAFVGNLFAFSNIWSVGPGGLTFPSGGSSVALANGLRAGVKLRGLGIFGDRTSGTIGTAFAFYDSADYVDMSDIMVEYWPGRVIWGGIMNQTTRGCIRESTFSHCRFFNCGSPGLPVIEIDSNSTGNSEGSNELAFSDIDIFAPYGDGISIHSSKNGVSLTRMIRVRIEGLQPGIGSPSGDLIRIGNTTDAQNTTHIRMTNMTLLNPYSGHFALVVTNGATAPDVPYGIHFHGSITGSVSTGAGIQITAGRNMQFYPWLATSGIAVTVGPSSGGVQSNILIDEGTSTSGTWSIDSTSLQAVIANTKNNNPLFFTFAGIPPGGVNTRGIKVSNATNFGIFYGSGAPTLSAAKGSLYLCSNGSSTTTRMYVNTDGGTTWTAVTTVA